MSDTYATSFGVLNYSGMLFNKGNTRTPLSSIIGSKAIETNSVEFVTGLEYATGGGDVIPNISESDSLTAPASTVVTREQKTNVTQIFHEAVGVSYGKMSNMGTLSGVNIAGQTANPMNELDFQVAAKMQKIANDIENVFINGVYNKATSDATVNKTRGLVAAATEGGNVLDLEGKAITLWDIADLQKSIYESNGDIANLTLLCDAVTLYQINADATQNGLTVVPASREINGIKLNSVVTPLGNVNLLLGERLPAGTSLLLNLDVIRPVLQSVPGKGNFFLEELAKVGAGNKYQIFGQVGLDHGPEWYHGVIKNISTGFASPEGKKVVITAPVPTIEVDAKIKSASLNKTTVEASDTAKVGVASIKYNVVPGTDATLAYLWQIKDGTSDWEDLTSSYTGYNTSELTVKAADAGKKYRCKVTASGSATGTVYTNECTVASE